MTNKNRLRGFTLIELLVVIAIIGILVALSLIGIQEARKGSRDAKRKSDLEQIRSAMEMYKADNGHYPMPTTVNTWVGISNTTSYGLVFATEMVDYLTPIPVDSMYNNLNPCSSATSRYGYYYRFTDTNSTQYQLVAGLETSVPSANKCVTFVGTCTNIQCYMVRNP